MTLLIDAHANVSRLTRSLSPSFPPMVSLSLLPSCLPAGIAMDQQQELHVQAAMVEELDQEMDKANAQLTNVNHKMKDVLDQAGGGQT